MYYSNYFLSKRNLTLVVLILTLSFSHNMKAQENQQFYNYGFEEWVNEGSDKAEPAHWHSFMSASGSFGFLMSQQIASSNETRPGSQGDRSARIYSKSIVGVTANGNMTTGRINAGSMSPSGAENYNYTQRNSDFCTPITVLPDSLSVWVCFRAADANSQASVMATIHGDADFQQLGDGSFYPADMLCAKAEMNYSRTCALGNDYVWKRLTVPFKAYPDICTDYRYILATFTTNKTAGGGNANDEVLIDDIYLIYNPSIAIGEINNSYQFPADGSELDIDIPFIIEGTMSANNLNIADNQVIAQISDSNGNFDNPTEIGRVTTNESGIINAIIPYSIQDGNGYRLRVVSTNYSMTSQDNGFDIEISGSNGVEDYFLTDVNIYPNPTDDFIKINSNNVIKEINIFSIDGRMVYSNHVNQCEAIIDATGFNKGTYIVRMISDRDVVVKRIVKT